MQYPDEKYFPDKPTLQYGNGDGTVNARSLRGCLNWSSDVKRRRRYLGKRHWLSSLDTTGHPTVFHKEFPGVDHMKILTDGGVIQYIKQVMFRMNNNATAQSS